MTDPLLLLRRMAGRADAVYIWTHYFDDEEMPPGDPRRVPFSAQEPPNRETVETAELNGVPMNLHMRSYYQAWKKSKYCGGPRDRHFWLEKAQLIAALRALGFDDLSFAHETPDHPNGPAISIFARRSQGA
jgi:hypothetical protein